MALFHSNHISESESRLPCKFPTNNNTAVSQTQFRMQWSEPPKFETQNPYEKKTDASKTQLSKDNLQCKVPAAAKSTHPKYNLKGTVHGPNSKPTWQNSNGKKNNRTEQLQIGMSEHIICCFNASLACSSRVTISMGTCHGQIFSCITMLFIVEKPDSASSESFGRPWKGGPVCIYIYTNPKHKHVPSAS